MKPIAMVMGKLGQRVTKDLIVRMSGKCHPGNADLNMFIGNGCCWAGKVRSDEVDGEPGAQTDWGKASGPDLC